MPSAGGVRVLQLARCLIADGENRMDAQALEAEVTAFDHIQELEMQEIQRIPSALRIALCTGCTSIVRDVSEGHCPIQFFSRNDCSRN